VSDQENNDLPDAEEWCLLPHFRKEISGLVKDKASDPAQVPIFLVLLELDMQLLRVSESEHRQEAVRRFAASLAANVHELLGIRLGRGRSGVFYNVLGATLRILGIATKDLLPYAIHGINATILSDKELLQSLPLIGKAEQFALKNELLQRR